MRDLTYAEYISIQKAFSELSLPETEDENTIHRFVWDVLRQNYQQEELLKDERIQLTQFFHACTPASYNDDILHEYGAHRDLYDYITKKLRFDCVAERGKVYRRAKLLLESNGVELETNLPAR
ncbi:MAG: hypothetical protein KAI83_02680 [Thiomargarita sp.]|nr:hypothetical protein [Thiomargarita sp.]